ncbi:hypothetical protein AK812_SmicGene5618 [Symbiodinium microadriaticum]|uniref:Uncharacterized protein n=1 Tax=Symbiodinium microadriaticum TaxID=2951 RepID=A0A1Q9ETA1_SYMMI|nr:hypothetical protein AK812_SmicGene5618 [Symbiodinium microadriaticum]
MPKTGQSGGGRGAETLGQNERKDDAADDDDTDADAPDFLAKLGLDPQEVLAQCPELKKAVGMVAKLVPLPNLQAKLQFLQQELSPQLGLQAAALGSGNAWGGRCLWLQIEGGDYGGRGPKSGLVKKSPADLEDLQSSLVWLEEFLWNQDWAAGFGRAALAEVIVIITFAGLEFEVLLAISSYGNRRFEGGHSHSPWPPACTSMLAPRAVDLVRYGAMSRQTMDGMTAQSQEDGLEGTIAAGLAQAWLENHGLDDEAVRRIAADARA